MTPQSVLHFTDPRLGLRTNDASAEDALTRMAMRILDDMLLGAGDAVLCAPAVGIPVRLIAIRQGAQIIHVLNPRVSAVSDMHMNRAETFSPTGPIRRHTWRGRKVTLTGQQAGGLGYEETLEGALAIAVQQAMELLENRSPFDWITGFHRHWIGSTNPVARSRADGLNRALHQAAATSDGKEPLVTLDTRMVRVNDDAGQALAVMDALNPVLPVDPLDLRCMGILTATSALREILITSARHFPLACGTLALLPNLTVHHLADCWPLKAMATMDMQGAFRTARLTDPPPAEGEPGTRFDALVADETEDWLTGPDAMVLMRLQARRLSGRGGVVLVCCAAPSAAIEDLLQAVFPVLYAVEDAQAGTIYVAAKARLDMDAARARAVSVAHQASQPALIRASCDGWQLITKSGDRVAQ